MKKHLSNSLFASTLLTSALAGCGLLAPTSHAKNEGPKIATPALNGQYNIRDFGARGDGKTIDSDAINAAIEAAAKAGGGNVEQSPPARTASEPFRARVAVRAGGLCSALPRIHSLGIWQ